MLHCISTDGTSCDPCLILPRLAIDNEIFDEIPTRTVMFATQKKAIVLMKYLQNGSLKSLCHT